MKLLLFLGICAILCIQFSHQLPTGKKDRKIPLPLPDRRDGNGIQEKRYGKVWTKSHGVREVGGDDESDIGNGVFVDSDTATDEKVLSKRGGLFRKIKDKVKDHIPHIPVKRDAKVEPFPSNEELTKTVVSDLGEGVHFLEEENDVKTEEEKEIKIVKRGWFKKLWNKIKSVIVGSLIGMIKRDINDHQQPIDNNEDDLKDIDVALSDDIIEVQLGTDFDSEEEKEKVIQKVKRGWFKKIRRKIKKVLTGAVVGSLVGGVVKRGIKNEEDTHGPKGLPLLLKTLRLRPGTANEITEIVAKLGGDLEGHGPINNHDDATIPKDEDGNPPDAKPKGLPLLLKTLRLRPGTADAITEIVEKPGGDLGVQDKMIDEILNDDNTDHEDDDTVLDRNGKSVRCRFVRGKFICF